MTIEQSAVIFGTWMKEHDMVLEDYDADTNIFKCSIVPNGRDEETIQSVMREGKVILITFASQAGVNVDGLRLKYRVIDESQREESMEMCEELMLRLLGKMFGISQ